MAEKILTISIAAYNVEQYIEKALNSILDERIIDDIEILVVDDGGTDNTYSIACEYSKKYPGVVIPIHKENGGYGSTINTSLVYARGKYFKQLDGDDWFQTENLVELVQLLRKIDVDLIICATDKYFEKNHESITSWRHGNLHEGQYKIEEIRFQDILGMHMSVLRTKLLVENSIKITEKCFYTDVELVTLPLPYIETVYIWPKAVYVYRIGREGQSISQESVRKHYKEHESVFWKLFSVYEKTSAGAKKDLMTFRIRKEISQHLVFLCYLPISLSTKKEMISFYNTVKSRDRNIAKEAKKYGEICRFLIDSHFLLYPLIAAYVQRRNKK